MHQTRRGLVLIELPFVLAAVGILISLLFPALEASRRAARQMENSSQLRTIHQNMVTYAMTNRSYYPGIRSDGRVLVSDDDFAATDVPRADRTGANPSVRLELLLRHDFFTGRYIISPAEQNRTPWDHGDQPLTAEQFSYAMSRLTLAEEQTGELHPHPRNGEWRDTSNSMAAVLSDRNTPGDSEELGQPDAVQSIWTTEPGDWRGSVGWNDNHVTFESGPLLSQTQYGKGRRASDDNLFQSAADATLRFTNDIAPNTDAQTTEADARMVHTGP